MREGSIARHLRAAPVAWTARRPATEVRGWFPLGPARRGGGRPRDPGAGEGAALGPAAVPLGRGVALRGGGGLAPPPAPRRHGPRCSGDGHASRRRRAPRPGAAGRLAVLGDGPACPPRPL